MRNASAFFMSQTETIMCLTQIVTLHGCEERMGGGAQRGSTIMQAL